MDSFTCVKVIKMKTSLYILSILILFSCSSEYKAPIVVSDIEANTSFERLDKIIFTDSLAIDHLKENAADFAKVYVEDIMRLAPIESPMAQDQLNAFVKNTLWSGLQHSIDSTFSDLAATENQIKMLLKKSQQVLPTLDYPSRVYWFNSGYNVAIYPDSAFLGVGLEWYLGKDSEYIKMLPPENFPMYKREKMQQDHIVADLFRGFFFYSLYSNQSEEDLLNLMVFYGKALFVLKQVSGFSDEDVLNYNKQDMQWANANQKLIWRRIVQEDWLYSKKPKLMSEFTKDGPFTKGFPQESPSRLGWYLGYKMVSDYANDFKEANLSEIIHAPANEILMHYKKP